MFFYCFDINRTINIYQSHHKSQSGDLIFYNNKYYLNLWEHISRSEQWATTIHFDQETTIKWFCHHNTLELLHRMVNEWFSSYNKCIPLFFWSNIATVLKHKKIIPDSKRSKNEQQLFLFPSVLSISQYNQNHNEDSPLMLTGQSSDVQQAKAYRSVHNNESLLLYTTHSQIFQDRNNLKSITIIDEYSPLYQTYQDPRYNIIAVVEKMKEIYKIK